MKANKFNFNLVFVILVALFFFLPFERIPTVEVFDFTVKISYLFGAALILSTIFFKNVRLRKFEKSDIFLTLFLIYGFISVFWACDLTRALVIWSLWFFVALIYKIISSLKLSDNQRKKIIDIILYSTLLVALFGLYQFVADSIGLSQSFTGLRYQYTKAILGFPRIQSVALEPLYFSNFLLVPLYLTLKRYFDQKKFFSSYFWLTFLIMINIFLGVARSAYLALVITLILLIFYLITKNEWQKIYKILLSIILSFIFSIILLFTFNGLEATKTYFDHITVGDTGTEVSTVGRMEIYKSATEVFLENPLGIGISSWGVEHQSLVDYSNIKSYGNINNQYLEILVEVGVIGFLFYLLFIVFYLREIFANIEKKSTDKLLVIMIGLGILAIITQYNFFSTLYIIYIWAFLGLLKNTKND